MSSDKISYPKWFLSLGVFCLIFSSNINFLTWGPIIYQASDFLQVTVSQLNLLTFLNFPISAVFGILAIYLYDTSGIYYPMVISGFLVVIGGLLRIVAIYITKPNFILLAIGQLSSSIGSPFYSMATSKIADLWFSRDERFFGNAIMTVANPLSFLGAFLIGPAMINQKGEEVTAKDFQNLLWIYLAPAFLGVFLVTHVLTRYRKKKDNDHELSEPTEILKFLPTLKNMATTPCWWWSVLACGSGVGFFNVVCVNMPQILCPLGYSQEYASSYGVTILVTSGFIGNVLITKLLARFSSKNQIKWISKILLMFLMLSMILCCYLLQAPVNYTFLTLTYILVGFTAIPFLPISFEFCIEATYPAGPATTAGFCWIFGQVYAAIGSIIYSIFSSDLPENWYEDNQIDNVCVLDNSEAENEDKRDRYFRISNFVIVGISLVFQLLWLFLYKYELRRRNYVRLSK